MSATNRFTARLGRLKEYYEAEFSLDPALSVIGTKDFHMREFGFQVVRNGDLRFVRNISFPTPEALFEYIQATTPLSIYVGAIYSEGPDYREQRSIHQVDWIRRELIFDIDLTDYDEVRFCGCRGKNEMCEHCWELVNVGARWIHETMVEDFGVEGIKWDFSGRRGLHATILDYDFSTLDEEQRAAIVNYLTFFKGEGKNVKYHPPAKHHKEYNNRMWHLLYQSFFKEVTVEQLIEIGFGQSRALQILNQRDRMGVSNEFLNRHVFVRQKLASITPSQQIPSKEEILETILFRWSPRLDSAVTVDLRRILRMPGSVHGDTGRVVRFIEPDEFDFFDPLLEESIYD